MFSYARGPEAPLIEATVGRVLEETAAAHPSALALVSRHQGLRLTFGELHKQAAQVAAGLAELGLRPGDRAGVWASNSAEWVLLQLGAAIAGAVLVNVNPAYRSHELRFVLQKSRMKALFFHERDARADYLEILAEARSGLELPLEHAIPLAGGAWRRMLATGGAPARPALSPGDVVNIQYTSGTTGSPKGVLLTHRNLLNNAWLVGQSLKVAPGDRLCAPVPLYHCFGCVMGSLMCLVHGIPIVLPSAQFDAGAALAAVEAERCTLLYGVPTMFIAELEYPGFARYDLSCLRSGIMAGAPCPIDVMRRVVEQMHCREMTIAYGQTEASPVITQSATDDSLELRVSTVGRCLPNTEVKIVEPRSGRTVPAGEPGELCARGYLVMKGYDGEPEATAAAIDPEGWLHTGDLATMREDGCFHIRGRSKEMIIRGGENIFPREIEEFLRQHAAIADVYVVGLPDEKLGETVLAWVRLAAGAQLTEAGLREYCRGKIAHFKIPQHVRFVDAFPMTVTGKVQKFRIREQEIEARGLASVAAIRTA